MFMILYKRTKGETRHAATTTLGIITEQITRAERKFAPSPFFVAGLTRKTVCEIETTGSNEIWKSHARR